MNRSNAISASCAWLHLLFARCLVPPPGAKIASLLVAISLRKFISENREPRRALYSGYRFRYPLKQGEGLLKVAERCPGLSFAQSASPPQCKSLIVPGTQSATLAPRMATSRSRIACSRRDARRTTPGNNGMLRCVRQSRERSRGSGRL